MKFEPMVCPECNKQAIGAADYVPACATFTQPDANGHVEYSGNTELFWDGQMNMHTIESTPETFQPHHSELQCENGHRWLAKEVD